jgi:predicted Fe-Mo cluster-binding NifX family protein
MRIAVPIWEDKISPVLDTATRLLILEKLDRENISRKEAPLEEKEISRRCFRIRKLGVDLVICGAVSRSFSGLLKASGVQLIQGISGDVEDILEAYFKGKLNQPRFLMPGFKRKY